MTTSLPETHPRRPSTNCASKRLTPISALAPKILAYVRHHHHRQQEFQLLQTLFPFPFCVRLFLLLFPIRHVRHVRRRGGRWERIHAVVRAWAGGERRDRGRGGGHSRVWEPGGSCKGGRKGAILVEFGGEGLNYARDPCGRDIGSELQES